MKALKCEMCDSSDIIKENGFYVCQNCGTKYTIEEAKKMMIEGTVDVQGTVKVDDSERLNNLYTLARRARQDNDDENAAKYYDQIAIENPNSWEAQFYKIYCSCTQTKIANMGNSCVKLANCLDSVFEMIQSSYTNETIKNVHRLEVYNHCYSYANMILDNVSAQLKNYNDATYAREFATTHIKGVFVLFIKLSDVCKKAGMKEKALQAAKSSDGFFRYVSKEEKEAAISRIKLLDPSYTPPASGGCYVATAVYGSYDCPEVWTLRRYRDYTLAETWYGRAFIHTYYAISPTIVKWFGNTDWFKKMWRGKLDRMVADLRAKGIEDTPYSDRKW